MRMIDNNVKMVIWDLDDTFWKGTLAEVGSIETIPENIEILKILTGRGIVSSICSRNDFATARDKLTEQGVWDLFVFPRIEFAPKGVSIAEIIETANLRPDNVLFIDDNPMNLEEAKHFSPTLMTGLPEEVLQGLLDSPRTAGKPDPEHIKLEQYKNIERKSQDRVTSTTSNEEFLRGCDIRIEIDFDLEKNIDRIVDLANKSNQLNFTKVRIETDAQRKAFDRLCGTYGVSVGAVSVIDNYGDYGIVGFFVLHKLPHVQKLHHFVFSCRIMNMGIEQYVYDHLGRPQVNVISPVANPIEVFDDVDWISEGRDADKKQESIANNGKLVLLGGCELLQLSAMCSSVRAEFVNEQRNGQSVRYDDAGFILGDLETMEADAALTKLGSWTAADKRRLNAALADAEIVIIAPFNFAAWNYFRTSGGSLCRIREATLQTKIRDNARWFLTNFQYSEMSDADRMLLLARSLAHIADVTPVGCRRFALGIVSGATASAAVSATAGRDGIGKRVKAKLAERYIRFRADVNETVRRFCQQDGRYDFVDVEAIIPPTEQYDADHFTRRGYILLTEAMNAGLRRRDGGATTPHGAAAPALVEA
jgi:FkbH-like protein